jgi:hypothetical protein
MDNLESEFIKRGATPEAAALAAQQVAQGLELYRMHTAREKALDTARKIRAVKTAADRLTAELGKLSEEALLAIKPYGFSDSMPLHGELAQLTKACFQSLEHLPIVDENGAPPRGRPKGATRHDHALAGFIVGAYRHAFGTLPSFNNAEAVTAVDWIYDSIGHYRPLGIVRQVIEDAK